LKKKDEGLVRIVGIATNMHVWFKCMQKKINIGIARFYEYRDHALGFNPRKLWVCYGNILKNH
jgi:hypothetical protein